MKKRILAAVVAAASVLSLAGCNGNNTSSGAGTGSGSSTPAASNTSGTASNNSTATSTPAADLKDEDEKLSILAWSNNEDMDLIINFFCEKTGYDKSKIEWVKLGDSGGDAKEKYMEYLKGDGDADLLFCDAGWAQKYENNGECIPMSELGITKDQYPNAYSYTLEVGTNEAGEFMAPTWQATPGLFVYNTKAAEEHLGVKTPEEMQAKVKDWATLEATAEELKTKSGGKCKMLSTEGGLWQVKQCDKKAKWVNDGKFVLTEEADAFVDMAKNYSDKGYLDASIGTWSTGWWNSVNSGSALGEFVPTWGLKGNPGSMIYNFAAGGKENDKGEFVANDKADNTLLAACAGPQSWYWGGTYICASKKCNTKKTASEFLKLMTQNDEAMKEYGSKNGDFMNNKKIMPDVSFKNPVLKDGQDQFKILVNEADKINMGGTITQYDADINDKFNAAVGEYCKGTISSKDDAIKQAKKDIAELYTDLKVE